MYGVVRLFSWTRAVWYRPGSEGIGAAGGGTSGGYDERAYSFEMTELSAAGAADAT